MFFIISYLTYVTYSTLPFFSSSFELASCVDTFVDNDAVGTSSPLPLSEILKTVDELSDVDVDIDDESDETEKLVAFLSEKMRN